MKTNLLTLIFFFCTNLILAQRIESIGHIQGSVLDAETKSPLIGVNIFIKEFQIGTTTDLEGKYILKNVPIGLVTLTLSYIGYESVTKTDISVKPNKTISAILRCPHLLLK